MARILFITQNFPPETSAAANRLGAMADALAVRHELSVVALWPSFPSPALYDRPEVASRDAALPYRVRRAFRFKPHRGSFVVRALREQAVAVLLTVAAARERADVVVTSSPIMFLAPVAWLLAKLKSAKLVWDVRDVTWLYAKDVSSSSVRRALAALLERYMWFVARRADLVAVPTAGSRELFVEHGTPASRVIIVENTISEALIDMLHACGGWVEKERPLVAYAGVIGHMHDLGALVDAARELPDVDFVIAGEGVDRAALEERARAEGVENVEFVGYVSREYLQEIYQRTDILFGSMRDRPTFNRATVPTKLFEYMAVGKPIVFAGNGFAAELVREADCGVSVAPDDGSAISLAIRSLLRDRPRIVEMGANGRRFVARTPSRERVMADFARVLDDNVTTHAPPRAGWLTRNLRAVRLMSDAASVVRFLALKIDRGGSGTREVVPLCLKPLRGSAVYLRRGTADRWAVRDAFAPAAHLPPKRIAADDIAVVWDLGANIGLTMAHMAVLFPRARIVGVELDRANAELCATNVARWRERCRVVQGAVWPEDGTIEYRHRRGDESRLKAEAEPGSADGETRRARALSLNSLLALDGQQPIDYVKMDIEGAERAVLQRNTEWAARVRAIKVEVHPPYTTEECLADLRRLGFEASAACISNGMPQVIGVRNSGSSRAL